MVVPANARTSTWAKRLILALDHGRDIALFPNRQTIWHFDDKIAQIYLLRAAGLPIPDTWVLWRYEDAVSFCRTARYPLVLKLATGIMSKNVKLLRNASDAKRWVNRLFGPGRFALEHPLRTAAKDFVAHVRTAKTRARRPERRADLQTNYLFVQEFLADNDFDTRITVIGDRAFGFRRRNRPGDFRASGSGRIEHDPAPIDLDAVRLAFKVARMLGTQSLAVDVLRRDGRPVLTEISYMYEGWAVARCPGHWKSNRSGGLEWVQGEMRPEDAILEDFLTLVGNRRRSEDRRDLLHGVRR